MDDKSGYAVFFFPQALESLGDAIKPYLQQSPTGEHIVCRNIDTGGSMFKMDLDGRTTAGEAIELELMVPSSMVRMIVSARSEEAFGFGPRVAVPTLVPRPAGEPRTAAVSPATAPAPAASAEQAASTQADAAPEAPAQDAPSPDDAAADATAAPATTAPSGPARPDGGR